MKRLALLFLLAGCATPAPRGIQVKFSDDLKLDHDQMLVCAFLKTRSAMVCMSPEEFQVRVEATADEQPDIERDPKGL